MKISAKDEYGLRILLRIAQEGEEEGMSISRLSEAEGISEPYVAKITRMLRLNGFIQSTRGSRGGYVLMRNAAEIKVNDVLRALDGKLFDETFCGSHSGTQKFCTNSVDCSVRSLWKLVQHKVDEILDNITLQDLMNNSGSTALYLQPAAVGPVVPS